MPRVPSRRVMRSYPKCDHQQASDQRALPKRVHQNPTDGESVRQQKFRGESHGYDIEDLLFFHAVRLLQELSDRAEFSR